MKRYLLCFAAVFKAELPRLAAGSDPFAGESALTAAVNPNPNITAKDRFNR